MDGGEGTLQRVWVSTHAVGDSALAVLCPWLQETLRLAALLTV